MIFQHPNIVYDNTSIGGPDIEIDIHVENADRFRDILKEFRDSFHGVIREHETMRYIKEHKFTTGYSF